MQSRPRAEARADRQEQAAIDAERQRDVVPFAFTGKLTKLTLSIDRPKLTPEDEKWLMEAQRNNKTSE
jgi:hypothetical protein